MSITANPQINGVDVPTLFATLDAVRAQNEIAAFRFRASNTWVRGTHSRSTYTGFFGAGQEMQHRHETVVESDHPEVLVGSDQAPTPVEYLLHAIAACLTAGIVNVAAARGVELRKVTSKVEGDIDLLGILGLSRTTRSETATERSGSRSRSTGTPTTSGCADSSSSRADAPPCTTRSPTRPPS